MSRFDRDTFETVVREALETLPGEFRHALENVAVTIHDEPSAEILRDIDLDPNADELFGLYQGIPLTERSHADAGLPDRILLFRGPFLRCFESRGEIEEEIRRTVVHELGHHMGLSDDEMPY